MKLWNFFCIVCLSGELCSVRNLHWMMFQQFRPTVITLCCWASAVWPLVRRIYIKSSWKSLKRHTLLCCRTPPLTFFAQSTPPRRQCGRGGRRKQLFLTPLALPRDELLTAGGVPQKATKQHFPTQHSTHPDQNSILIGYNMSYFHNQGPWDFKYCQPH